MENYASMDLTKEHVGRVDIEKIVGMKIKNLQLYQRALVHKSIQKFIKKYDNDSVPLYVLESNERLEFIGDSVLGLIIAEYLFDKFEHCDEGFLTRMRTKLVNGKTLSNFARHLNLGEHILMGKHVINIDGKNNNRILEDAFESIIGAVYKDLGYKHARAFVIRVIERVINFDDLLVDNNYKDVLLRYAQSKSYGPPIYELRGQSGPPHKPTFTVEVIVNEEYKALGHGASKKEAEQNAAKILSSELEATYDRDLIKYKNNLKE